MIAVVAVAQVGSLFAADAWNNVTFTAGEVKNPHRDLPLSLAIGTGVVILLYMLANFGYLAVLPLCRRSAWCDDPGSGNSICLRGSRGDGSGSADRRTSGRRNYGDRYSYFQFRLH